MMKLCGNNTKYFVLPIVILLISSNDSWAKYSVLLIRPDASLAYLNNEVPIEKSDNSVNDWDKLLDKDSYQVDIKPESRLKKRLNSYAMVILPEVLCLGEIELKTLHEYLDKGGGLLLTGGTGSRDTDGKWRGYDFLETELGTIPRKAEASISQPLQLHLRREVVGSMALPPGYDLQLTPHDTVLYLPETDSVEIGGFWSYAVNNKKVGYALKKTLSGGRLAWFGVDLNDDRVDSVNREQIQPMFDQLFLWLSAEHVVSSEPWRDGYKSAVLVHGDITNEFDEITKVVKLFDSLKISATYSLVTDSVATHPQLIKYMVEAGGEIALIGDNEEKFSGQIYDRQIQRLKNGMDALSDYINRPYGFRPPFLVYNGNSISALQQLGFRYILADHNPVGSYPRYIPSGFSKQGIVFFPQSAEGTFERIQSFGGYFGFNYSSKLFRSRQTVKSIEKFLAKVRTDSTVWITTADSIAQWVKQREQLTVTANRIDNKFKIKSLNSSDSQIAGVVLRIVSPILNPNLELASSSEPCLLVDMGGYYQLHLPSIDPDDQFSAVLRWEGKIPLREAVPVVLEWFLYGVLVLAVFFIGWSVIYFAFSKGKVRVEGAGNSALNLQKQQVDHTKVKPVQFPQPNLAKPQPSMQINTVAQKSPSIRTTIGWKLPEQVESDSDKAKHQSGRENQSNAEDWN